MVMLCCTVLYFNVYSDESVLNINADSDSCFLNGGGGGENFRGMRETSMLNYYATATLEGEKESERDGNFSQYFC